MEISGLFNKLLIVGVTFGRGCGRATKGRGQNLPGFPGLLEWPELIQKAPGWGFRLRLGTRLIHW